jgi:polyhydroxybutyrate depolymerase
MTAATSLASWRGRLLPAALGGVLLLTVTAATGCRAVPRAGLPAAGGAGPATPASGPLPTGSTAQALRVHGVRRTFRVYRPAGLRRPAPLVVMLHGGFGSAAQAERSYHWDRQAAAAHFVVAYPDGLDHAWNVGGGCCGVPGRQGTDDVGFITAMVAAIARQVPIDPDRVYATGISNGGMLAYRLACDTTIFAAIGPDSATMLGPCPSPAPISVVHVHGTADRNIPYWGGPGDGVARIDGPSIPALNGTWRATDHCAAPAVTRAGVLTTSVARCPGGRAVELITIAGAGHQWPGSVPPAPLAARLLHLDQPSTALDATTVIWRFFAAHPRQPARQPGRGNRYR